MHAEAALPTRFGTFKISVFEVDGSPGEVAALIRGRLDGPTPPLVRLHSECLTGDVLGSLRCDCGQQLEAAFALIAAAAADGLPPPGRANRHARSVERRVVASGWFAAPREVELREEALPRLEPADVRVEAVASAISHGTEMLVFRGQVPAELELDLPTLRGSFDFPIKYGYASVGRVVECGSAVDRLEVGDHVFVHHPHQTSYVVPQTLPIRLPDGLDPMLGVFLANVEAAVT